MGGGVRFGPGEEIIKDLDRKELWGETTLAWTTDDCKMVTIRVGSASVSPAPFKTGGMGEG
jgi:hypothetical protein